jgi:hypothetical protein
VACCCEDGNELPVSIKCGEFLDELLDFQEGIFCSDLVISSCTPIDSNSDKDSRSSFVRKFRHAEFSM